LGVKTEFQETEGSNDRKRALVIGGSVGGLFAATLLRSVGWDAVVFERNAEELAAVARHQHSSGARRRVAASRRSFDDTMAIHVDRVIFLDNEGRPTTSARPRAP